MMFVSEGHTLTLKKALRVLTIAANETLTLLTYNIRQQLAIYSSSRVFT